MNETKNEFAQSIIQIQKKLAATFLKEKKDFHEKEDPSFLDDISDIFDIRLWNTVEFSPEANSEGDKRFEKELDSMKRKLFIETSKKFYENIREEKVVEEFEQCVRIVYDEAKNSQLIATAKKKDHILHQWTFPPKSCPFAGREDSDRDVSTCWKG